jgi:hypothetical protein
LGSDGQTMVEFALVFPLVFLLICLTIDFGRAIYTYSSISSAAAEGVRVISLTPDDKTDCYALGRMKVVAQGFVLTSDPNSVNPTLNPINGKGPSGAKAPTTTPPINTGYMYIFPAVAASPGVNAPNCDAAANNRLQISTGEPQGEAYHVVVSIRYHFVPLTPLAAQLMGNRLVLNVIASGSTEQTHQ